MNEFWRRILALTGRIGSDPNDIDEVRLQKALLVGGAVMFIFAGALWGFLYIGFGQPFAGYIPLGYAVVSLLSIILVALTHCYHFFRYSQLVLILLLPFFLMLALGGFINSSAVILWSLIAPFGALLFDEPRYALRWLWAYLGLVVLSGFIQAYLPAPHPLSPGLVTFFFVMNIGVVSAIVIILLNYFVSQKNLFQEKSENLLLNILPKEIANILKNESRTIADHYESASILFADMVNFTPMSAEMSPVGMVELLNEIFSHFDGLVEKYDLEKIKTVGDCYLVAARVPRPRPDHAKAITLLALEMQAYLQSHSFNANRSVAFRIGINSGPVLAGVIGRKKFIYDLWGDAVNTASRMESHGRGGCVQITQATRELIKDDFVCESRGSLIIKGKGEMEIWHVIKAKPEAELASQ